MFRPLLFLALLLLLAPDADGQGAKKRLAVMPVAVNESVTTTRSRSGDRQQTEFNIPPPEDFARGLTEMLTSALVNTRQFVMLERAALDDIEAEQARTEAGLIADGTGAEGGQVLGAQVLVRAAITGYTYDRSERGGTARVLGGIKLLEGVGVSRTVEKASVVIDVRLYDAETSRILASQNAEGRAEGSETSVGIEKDEGEMTFSGMQNTPLGEASREAVEQAVAFILDEMNAVPWEGRLAAIDADDTGQPALLYINAGSHAGLDVGQRLTVLKAGRAIIDPETKVVLGRTRDQAIGTCEIIEVMPDLAIARPLDGSGFAEGDLVRID